jgi:hypothetical protein
MTWQQVNNPCWLKREGDVLRNVFLHSIALACLGGMLATPPGYGWLSTFMLGQ